jgi:hypothetical protein
VGRLLSEREPFYRRADIVVDADSPGPLRTAELIAVALGGLAPRTTVLI